jgi:murein DD-endopeptidase MepM/ murein hydrolase activator NlpD
MAKIKYYYDTETCRYERIRTSPSDILINAIGFVFICSIFGFGIAYLNSKYFPTQEEQRLKSENQELSYYYSLTSKELDNMNQMLEVLSERDDKLYRVIFEQEPIPEDIRTAGAGGMRNFELLQKGEITREELIKPTLERIDRMKRRMLIQTLSYDDLMKIANNKQEFWQSVPSIQPVNNIGLKRLVSGYGMRMHPIYKVKKLHAGVDFAAPIGTPIYATGDGEVTLVRNSLSGYGKQVEISHGFGFKTKYAHMSKYIVKMGQKVKRGEIIGYIGNTGASTGPHLHYEIHKDRKRVDPVHYFHNDLSPEEYDIILQLAAKENQSMG